MTKKEWDFRFLRSSAIWGIVIGTLTSILSAMLGAQPVKEDLIFGILVSLLTTILSLQIQQFQFAASNNSDFDEAIKIARNGVRLASINDKIKLKSKQLANLPDILQAAAIRSINFSVDGFTFDNEKGSIHIRGRRMSLENFEVFWQDLSLTQSKLRRSINVFVTHSSDEFIFYDKYARKHIKPHQVDFAKKGRIFRIYVDQGSRNKERIREYIKIMDQNRDSVISLYINVSSHKHLLDLHRESEFCIEDHQKSSVEWKLRDQSEVESFSLSLHPSDYQRHLNVWRDTLNLIRRYDYKSNEFEKDFVQLGNYRDEFFKRYDRIKN